MFSRLYLHIPWCTAKCAYCSFNSKTGSAADLDETATLLLREMELTARLYQASQPLSSIYFGGGTPSLLQPEQVGRLIEQSRRLWQHDQNIEITLEANPGTLTPDTLAGFRRAGVNRLSLGVQSFDDAALRQLGRLHSADQARKAVQSALTSGFDSIGLDLICGLPEQTLADWHQQLDQALELAPDHISVYNLTIEEGTPFHRQYPPGSPKLPDDDTTAAMLELADELLVRAGFEHYELANYARPGKRSSHNCGYWQRDGYLGLGPSAHSFLQSGWGLRFCNPPDHRNWAASIRAGTPAHQDITQLSREDARSEAIFLGLRQSDGVRLDRFEELFGEKLEDIYHHQLERLQKAGLLQRESGRLRLTRKGMLLSNQVFVMFI